MNPNYRLWRTSLNSTRPLVSLGRIGDLQTLVSYTLSSYALHQTSAETLASLLQEGKKELEYYGWRCYPEQFEKAKSKVLALPSITVDAEEFVQDILTDITVPEDHDARRSLLERIRTQLRAAAQEQLQAGRATEDQQPEQAGEAGDPGAG